MRLEGKRALGVGLVSGALAALAMPPLDWLPLAVVGIVVFVWLWDGAPTWKAALLRGWAWGLGHFAVGSYWIVEAFFVPPADFKLLGPPIVLGLAVLLGFFPGLAAGATRWAALRWPFLGGRYRRLVILAVAWTAAEWLRGHIFTGYPWNPLGHVWTFATPLLQGAAVVGVYGLGTATFLILAAPTAGWRASMVALAIVGGAGVVGVAIMPPVGNEQDGPVVRIVQPNTAQSLKWDRDAAVRNLRRLIDLSHRPGFDRVAVVLWPETAVPFIVQPGSPILPVLAEAVPPNGYLLTGAERTAARYGDGVWNSLLAIDKSGAIVAHYDKVHLVPLGEYIPFHKDLPPLTGLVGRGSFEVGESHLTLALPGVPPFSPVICYEVIFPGAIVGSDRRPRWIVNVTNDAWFGVSSGPYQHLASARLRSVEEGLPMMRAANTGVSAVIDAYGRVLDSLDMEQEGTIDHALPPARPATPYSLWHDWILLIWLLSLLLPAVLKFPAGRLYRDNASP
ncbi:apolipoprotein N-acyltransferase [Enhydrobacter aerosaccus]|uniref:Apolipoprotein N-acyltransferase n=1 Tax=Enhydrobacter aerosaccus TaxID=225324 RepID=A0A1T4R5E8_9HYPH|nr:apolipoprotein N-acyltransferase [Enhydrobacter aerosaccus]SKA10888.1 apolipoprotein N-acyltransferase [Enhydrobacter aerosaccus]